MTFVVLGEDRYEVLDIPGTGALELLLLHEGLGSVSMWGDFPQALARTIGARVVAYSRLGFGRSSPRRAPITPRFVHEEAHEVMPALRRELGLARPVLVGHSTGGSMALLHAAHDPASVAGVIALAPMLDVEESNLAAIREASRIFESTAWGARLGRHHAHPIEQVFTGWRDIWLSEGFRDWSIAPELAPIRCPILAIGGGDDPYSSPRQLDLLQQGARQARVERIDLAGCGHVPHRDQPEAVLAAIGQFLRDV